MQNTPSSPLKSFWLSYRQHKSAMIGMVTLVTFICVAIFAPWIAPYDPNVQFIENLLTPPAWHAEGSLQFILGTDDLGRDLLSRIIHGARLSISIGLFVVILSLIAGLLIGALAAMSGNPIEALIMRVMDMLLALPSLLLAIVIVAILGPSLVNAVIAVAIVYLPHFVRLTRASLKSELTQDYVKATELDGVGKTRLFFSGLLPNIGAPLIVQTTLSFSNAILDIAALGFLGLGAQPPKPEWGTLLSSSREFIVSAPWTVTLPGLAILITVLASNLMGDGLRDVLDPRLKR